MLRVFHHYHPRQIALYVKKIFSGRLQIDGIGRFDFANGKLLPPANRDMLAFSVVNEVNAEIRQLTKLSVA